MVAIPGVRHTGVNAVTKVFDGVNWLLCTTEEGLGVLGVDESAGSEIRKDHIPVHIRFFSGFLWDSCLTCST